MLTINDLPVSKELETREMSAASGGRCANASCSSIADIVKSANDNNGFYGAVVALGQTLNRIGAGAQPC